MKKDSNRYQVHKKLEEIKKEKLASGLSVCIINTALLKKYKVPYEFDLISSKKGHRFDGKYVSTELQNLYMSIKGLAKIPSLPASELVCHLFTCNKAVFDNVYSIYLLTSARDAYDYMLSWDYTCTVCHNLKETCKKIFVKLQKLSEAHEKPYKAYYYTESN